jgi:hypothetical protein
MWGQEDSSERELAELAALADGSLPAERRAAVEARVAASPRLQALLAEQRNALAAVRGRGERASPGLHRRIGTLGREARRPAPRRLAVALAAATLLAAALLIAIPGSEPGTPSLAEAAALNGREPAAHAQPPRPAARGRLVTRAAGLAYPDWSSEYGWRPAGVRHDRLGDRDTTTVFYAKGGRRIGYTIVSGAALSRPRAARISKEGSVVYLLEVDGRPVVTWLRRGHTCVLGGDRVRHATLLELASWRPGGADPF